MPPGNQARTQPGAARTGWPGGCLGDLDLWTADTLHPVPGREPSGVKVQAWSAAWSDADQRFAATGLLFWADTGILWIITGATAGLGAALVRLRLRQEPGI